MKPNNTTLRLSPELKAAIESHAKKIDRSQHWVMVRILEGYCRAASRFEDTKSDPADYIQHILTPNHDFSSVPAESTTPDTTLTTNDGTVTDYHGNMTTAEIIAKRNGATGYDLEAIIAFITAVNRERDEQKFRRSNDYTAKALNDAGFRTYQDNEWDAHYLSKFIKGHIPDQAVSAAYTNKRKNGKG
jgi:Predicted transcriptional regulator